MFFNCSEEKLSEKQIKEEPTLTPEEIAKTDKEFSDLFLNLSSLNTADECRKSAV